MHWDSRWITRVLGVMWHVSADEFGQRDPERITLAMALDRLSANDVEVVRECLLAAVRGPFFPDWGIPNLDGSNASRASPRAERPRLRLDLHEGQAAHSQSQTPKEQTVQHLNELKPEEQSQLTPEQAERNRQYGPIETALPTEAQGYKWQRETDGIHSYQHPETHRWLHIDTQGQFFDRHAQPITRDKALEQAGHSLAQSVAENAQSPTGSGLNLNGHGISL